MTKPEKQQKKKNKNPNRVNLGDAKENDKVQRRILSEEY